MEEGEGHGKMAISKERFNQITGSGSTGGGGITLDRVQQIVNTTPVTQPRQVPTSSTTPVVQPQQNILQKAIQGVKTFTTNLFKPTQSNVGRELLQPIYQDKSTKLTNEQRSNNPRPKKVYELTYSVKEIEGALNGDKESDRLRIFNKYATEKDIGQFKGAIVSLAKSTLDGVYALFENNIFHLNVPPKAQKAILESYPKFQKTMSKYVEDVSPSDPTFGDQLIQGIGSMAAFYGASLITGGGAMAPTVLESMGEAGAVYEQNKKNGMSNSESLKSATVDFVGNLIWNTVTNRFSGIFDKMDNATKTSVKRKILDTLGSATFEGVQEAGQQIMSNLTSNNPDVWQGVLESLGLGAIIGGGAKGLQVTTGADVSPTTEVTGISGAKVLPEVDEEKNREYQLEDMKKNPVVAHLPMIDGNPFARLTAEQAMALKDEVRAIETPTPENADLMLDLTKASAFTGKTPVSVAKLASMSEVAKRAFIKAGIITQAEITRASKTPKPIKLGQPKVAEIKPPEDKFLSKVLESKIPWGKEKGKEKLFNYISTDENTYAFHYTFSENQRGIVKKGFEVSKGQPYVFGYALDQIPQTQGTKMPSDRTGVLVKLNKAYRVFDRYDNNEEIVFNPKDVMETKAGLTFEGAKKIVATKSSISYTPKTIIKPKVVSVPRTQLPVGEGDKTASRLEARVKNTLDNVTQDQIDALGLSTFKQMNNDEQIAKASEYVIGNPDEALEVLKGNVEPPKGLLKNSIYVAMVNNSIGKPDLINKLASLSSTRFGQEIEILKMLDKDSPVKWISELYKIRADAVEKKYKSTVREAITKEAKSIEDKIEAPSKYEWKSFIDSIEC